MTLLNANPQGGVATIDKNFKIETIEDALFFSWVLNSWILKHSSNKIKNTFKWSLYNSDNGQKVEGLIKLSNGESYADTRFRGNRGVTNQEIILGIKSNQRKSCR